METYAISDIHGRIKELDLLLEFIGCQKDDRIVFLGDYIDRGPSSNEVIEKLIFLKETMPNAHFLKGNHEDMAAASRDDQDVHKFWMRYGGDKTLESYPNGIPNRHWDFICNLEKYFETENSIFVHAGLIEDIALEMQDDEVLMWNRLSFPISHYSRKNIYCGHSSQRSGLPITYGMAHCIDCTGWLTAINVTTNHVYQVNDLSDRRKFVINEHNC